MTQKLHKWLQAWGALATIGLLLVNIGGGIWFASSEHAKLKELDTWKSKVESQISEIPTIKTCINNQTKQMELLNQQFAQWNNNFVNHVENSRKVGP